MKKYLNLLSVIVAGAYFWSYTKTYTQWHFIDYINLIFHEAGHTIFFLFGQFFAIAAGSGLQIAIPLGLAGYFFYHHKYISSSICLMWTGQNFMNVSIYVRDAVTMNLELLGGDYVIHDWNYLLSEMGLLHKTDSIAQLIFIIGFLILFSATVWGIQSAWNTHISDTEKIHI